MQTPGTKTGLSLQNCSAFQTASQIITGQFFKGRPVAQNLSDAPPVRMSLLLTELLTLKRGYKYL